MGWAATHHPQRTHPLQRVGLCARWADTNFPAGINQGQQATPPFATSALLINAFLGLMNTCVNRNGPVTIVEVV